MVTTLPMKNGGGKFKKINYKNAKNLNPTKNTKFLYKVTSLISFHYLSYFAKIFSFTRWINDTENWIYDEDGVPMLCGNLTGARHCPQSNS